MNQQVQSQRLDQQLNGSGQENEESDNSSSAARLDTTRYIGIEPQRIEKAIEGHAELI